MKMVLHQDALEFQIGLGLKRTELQVFCEIVMISNSTIRIQPPVDAKQKTTLK